MSAIIVTGASGFLGRTFLQKISASGLSKRITAISTASCDLMDLDSVEGYSRKVDKASVVYFAGYSPYHGNEPALFQSNVIQITNFLSVFASKITHFIYISSADVYGRQPGLPITEKTCLAPSTSYAVSKLVSEYVAYQHGGEFPVTVFRVASAYGEFDDGRRALVGRLINSVTKDGVVNIMGDGQQVRELTYAGDIASIIVECLRTRKAGIFNLTSGLRYTLNDIVLILERAFGTNVKRNYTPSSKVQSQYFENSKLHEHFPRCSFARLETIAPLLVVTARKPAVS